MHFIYNMAQHVQSYKGKLETLSSEMQIPKEIVIIQRLLQNQRYCTNLICYLDAIFLYDNDILTTNFLAKAIKLKSKTFFSCMLSPHNLTSIYHNAWGEIKDDTFFPDNEHLPSIKTSSLYKNQNNLLTMKA